MPDREVISAAANAAGVAGLAGLFLPSLDSAWDASDGDEFTAYKIDAGTFVYLAVALGLGTLHSLAVKHPLPLLAAGGMAAVVVLTYRHAFSTEPPPKVSADLPENEREVA